MLYVCVFLYNKYTQYTYVYYVNKNLFLDAINRLKALKSIHNIECSRVIFILLFL